MTAAIGTSLPQPVGAVIAFLMVEQVQALLPLSSAFAAGAMLSLVVADVAPEAWRAGSRTRASVGAIIGAGLMIASGLWLGVS